jgi:3'(2'), 5'-bisphosphate nucleotidase
MLADVNNKKEDIFEVIKAAGNEILKVYQGDDFQVEIKSDETPLTIADKQSNNVIINGLKVLFPEIPILSEESKKVPYDERRNWKYLWVVDPLDGTKEFIKRNGEFSINLALIENGKPIFGVLYIPVMRLLYYAGRGLGAYRVDKNKKIYSLKSKKSVSKESSQNIGIIYSKSHYNSETREYVQKIRKKYNHTNMISVGSAMKLTYLAEGKADIYPRLGPTMEWDIAAGQIIVEETGGKVIDYYKRKPLIYNKEDLRNSWFLAFGHKVEQIQLI